MSLSNGYAHSNGTTLLEPATSGVVTTQDGSTLTHTEWLAEREKDFGLGASDLAIVAGAKGSVSKFWHQKKGNVPKDDVQGEQAWWGTKLEPIIAERFEQLTGEVLVSQQIFLRHPEYSWLYCTLDRLTLPGEIVELKCLSNFGNDKEDGFGFNPESPPTKWIIQAQQQLAITGEDHVRFAIFYGPELSFKECIVQRDHAMWAQLLEMAQAFRQSLIDDEPPTDFVADDAAMISKLYRGKADGPALELRCDKLLAAVKAYHAQADLGDREKEKEKAKAAILQALGTSTKATIGGFVINRKSTAKQTRLEVIPPEAPKSLPHWAGGLELPPADPPSVMRLREVFALIFIFFAHNSQVEDIQRWKPQSSDTTKSASCSKNAATNWRRCALIASTSPARSSWRFCASTVSPS
jgi:putative phage-type endonuclease